MLKEMYCESFLTPHILKAACNTEIQRSFGILGQIYNWDSTVQVKLSKNWVYSWLEEMHQPSRQ